MTRARGSNGRLTQDATGHVIHPAARGADTVDLRTFEASLAGPAPPAGVPPLVEALWHERRGDWDRAHEITQDLQGNDAAWVHAYLHRREGDQSNAAYWYRQAARPVMRGSLDDEWRAIVVALLNVLPTANPRAARD